MGLQVPQEHIAEQVWLPGIPPASQVCVADGAHSPSPLQALQFDQVPSLHVRVRVPQLPHDSIDGPTQLQAPQVH